MMSDWPEWKVGELERKGLLLVQDGNHGEYRPRKDEFADSGVAFIRAADFDNGLVHFEKSGKINATAFERISKGIGKDFDTILSTKGSVGKLAYVPEGSPNFVCSPQTSFWRSLKHDFLDPRFLYYELQSRHFINQILSRKGETDMADYLSLTSQRGLMIRVPEKAVQLEVVKILSSVDRKIHLNRQTNQTLEQIAQAIFKSWFVDFEPTRAKIKAKKRWLALHESVEVSSPTCYAEEFDNENQSNLTLEETMSQAAMCAISGKSLDELEQLSDDALQQLKSTAALFPDALVDSDLGEVPEGWEVVGFKNIIKKYIDNRGKTPPTTDTGIPLLEVKHLPEGSIKPNINTKKYVDNQTFDSWFRAHLETDDIIISTVGTIGRICMVPEGEKIAIAQNLLGMRFKREKVSPYFMYYQMDSFRFRHDVDARLVITVQASIKRKDLETIDLLSPPVELQNIFESFVSPFIAMLQSNQDIELEKIREILLPKLLSGQLDIN